MNSRVGTVVFFDLAGFSTSSDPTQVRIAQSFLDSLKEELTTLWGTSIKRTKNSPYLVLPTGDGAAVILWDKAPEHPSKEYTSLWLGGTILDWAQSQDPSIGMRCGINAGELDFVKDPYGKFNVCGAAINVAQRVMDAANPGQLLVRHDEITQRLSAGDENIRTDFNYHLEPPIYDVLAKHNVVLKVQNITGVFREAGKARTFGMQKEPANKWHLQIEPPILALDSYGTPRIKKPPVELLKKHSKIAFVGATNHQRVQSHSMTFNPFERFVKLTSD